MRTPSQIVHVFSLAEPVYFHQLTDYRHQSEDGYLTLLWLRVCMGIHKSTFAASVKRTHIQNRSINWQVVKVMTGD